MVRLTETKIQIFRIYLTFNAFINLKFDGSLSFQNNDNDKTIIT